MRNCPVCGDGVKPIRDFVRCSHYQCPRCTTELEYRPWHKSILFVGLLVFDYLVFLAVSNSLGFGSYTLTVLLVNILLISIVPWLFLPMYKVHGGKGGNGVRS